jgi:MOSC domain-containing protein YiiM
MFEGRILAIQIATEAKATPRSVDSVAATPGKGLQGDRYSQGRGAFSKNNAIQPDQEVTLIESESLAAASREYSVQLTHAETRRNLLTEGVPLNHLVGQSFSVGEVTLRGMKLCEPCGYLEKMTVPDVQKAFRHRGGLRAQVVSGGLIRVGDSVRLS